MKQDRGTYIRNMTHVAGAGSSGCSTIVVVMGALFVGLWLDSLLGTRPALTLLLTLFSIPLSLVLMVWIVLSNTNQVTPPKIPASKPQPIDNDDYDAD